MVRKAHRTPPQSTRAAARGVRVRRIMARWCFRCAVVMALSLLVAPAAPATAGSDEVADHVECFKIRDALPRRVVLLADLLPDQNPPFADQTCKVKLPASHFCVNVRKLDVVDHGGRPFPSLDLDTREARDYLCYQLRCPRTDTAVEVADQFGLRTLGTGRTRLLCAPAVKTVLEPSPTPQPQPTPSPTPPPACGGGGDGTGECSGECDGGSACVHLGDGLCGCGLFRDTCQAQAAGMCGDGLCPNVRDRCQDVGGACQCVRQCGFVGDESAGVCGGACPPGFDCVFQEAFLVNAGCACAGGSGGLCGPGRCGGGCPRRDEFCGGEDPDCSCTPRPPCIEVSGPTCAIGACPPGQFCLFSPESGSCACSADECLRRFDQGPCSEGLCPDPDDVCTVVDTDPNTIIPCGCVGPPTPTPTATPNPCRLEGDTCTGDCGSSGVCLFDPAAGECACRGVALRCAGGDPGLCTAPLLCPRPVEVCVRDGSQCACVAPDPTPTVTASVTPEPTPTATPTPSETPSVTLTPSVTPSPAATATPAGVGLFLRPPGGTGGSCRGTCVGGTNDGGLCTSPFQCSPGGSCAATCVGGPRDGESCTQAFDCNGCGREPPEGACNFYQTKTFRAFSDLGNGLCVPRDASASDIPCTTDVECAPGQTCRRSQLGTLVISPPTAVVDTSTFWVAPFGHPYGIACLKAVDDGLGEVDCDTVPLTGIDQDFVVDHNTTPSAAGNGGPTSGLPDDPSCTSSFTFPDGSTSHACAEGTSQCLDGTNAGSLCTVDSDCPGSACAPCNPFGVHTGACNSPVQVSRGGVLGAGDMHLTIPLAVRFVEPGKEGADGRFCTSDDEAAWLSMSLVLSTQTITVTVVDADNVAGAVIGESESCGPPCETSLTGTPIDCTDLAAGDVDGLTFSATLTGRSLDAPAFGDFAYLGQAQIGNPAYY